MSSPFQHDTFSSSQVLLFSTRSFHQKTLTLSYFLSPTYHSIFFLFFLIDYLKQLFTNHHHHHSAKSCRPRELSSVLPPLISPRSPTSSSPASPMQWPSKTWVTIHHSIHILIHPPLHSHPHSSTTPFTSLFIHHSIHLLIHPSIHPHPSTTSHQHSGGVQQQWGVAGHEGRQRPRQLDHR